MKNPTLWEAYKHELEEKGCTICQHFHEEMVFDIRARWCDKKHPWFLQTSVNRCKSGNVKT